MSKFIAACGSYSNPEYIIDGHITDHVKDKDRKFFVSVEFANELYTDEFWNSLKQLAKDYNKFIKLYVN